jgi:hypothetical protein
MPFLFSLYLCNFYAKIKLVVTATILSFCQSDILTPDKLASDILAEKKI